MADDVTVDNGGLTDYNVATDDDGAGKHVQIVKLAQSADGSRDPITADGDGLEVKVTNVSIPVTDNGGSLTVDGTVGVSGTVTVDGSGVTQPVSGTVSVAEPVSVDDNGSSLTVDNAALSVVGGGAEATALRVTVANDSTGVVSVDDNGGSLTVDGTVTVQDGGSTISIDDGAGSITVDGTVSVAEPVSVDDNGGSLTVDNAALAVVGGGAEATALRVTVANDSTGVVSVDDNGGSLTVDGTVTVQDGGGSVSIDDNGGSLTVDGTVTVTDGLNIEGDVAHDGGDSGNPVKIGAKAIAHGSSPTAVAASDRTDIYANRHGVQFVIGGHPNVVTIEYVATTAQTDDAIVSAASGEKIIVTSVLVVVDNATTVDVGVRIGFGASTLPTTPTDGNTATGLVMSHPGIAAGSGVGRGDGAGIIGIGADAEDLRITNEVPTTGSLRAIVTYYIVPS